MYVFKDRCIATADVDPENTLSALDGLILDTMEDQDVPTTVSGSGRVVEERRPMRGEPAMGPQYKGRTSSRSALFQPQSDDDDDSMDLDASDSSSELEEEEGQSAAAAAADALQRRLSAGVFSDEDDDDDSIDASNDSEDGSMGRDTAAEDQDDDEEEEQEQAATAQALSGVQTSIRADQERATSAKVQRNMWDTFLDLRIQLQPLLEASSRFPSPEILSLIQQSEEDPSPATALSSVNEVTQDLLCDLLSLQDDLFENNDQVKSSVRSKKRKFDQLTEEDRSDADSLWEYISQSNSVFDPWAASALDEWSSKALFASGINISKLKTLNQSITKQVDEILLSQRNRLMSRANLRRGGSSQLCHPDEEIAEDVQDAEVYDDVEFYQALLKELVEAGIQETSDPVELTRQFLKLRNAAGKKKHRQGVDRRASKGRKLKFVEHAKLLSFMAPEPHKHSSHDTIAAEQLSLSLFGKRSVLTL
jgi:protein AATF/BFR2